MYRMPLILVSISQRKVNLRYNVVQNEKLFEDKIEVSKNGTFPKFIQKYGLNKTFNNNQTLSTKMNHIAMDKNSTENLLKEVNLFVNGKSKLNQFQIEKVVFF